MYVIVDIQGQQFKVEQDQKLFVHRINADCGSEVEFEKVMLVDNESVVTIGTPVGYVKAPPDKAFIISGLRRKVVVGRSAIRIPFLERLDKLSLKVMSVDVKTGTAVPTNDYINVRVDGIVKIKISSDLDMIGKVAQNFLNMLLH